MISPISPSLDRFRRRVQAALFARLPEHVARLTWSAGQIAGHQRDSLRSLLAYAVARSEFHAGRLPASSRAASSCRTCRRCR